MIKLRPYRVVPMTWRRLEPIRKDCLLKSRLAVGVPADGHVQRFAGHIFSAGVMNDRCSRCDRSISTVLSEELACGNDLAPSDAQLAEIRAVKEQFMAAITGISKPIPPRPELDPLPSDDHPQDC